MAIRLSRQARADLKLIHAHLTDSYEAFGDSTPEALKKARGRIIEISEAAQAIARVPHQGTLHEDILPGLRHVTKNRTVFWFRTAGEDVLVLGVFYSGQDHLRHMRARLEG